LDDDRQSPRRRAAALLVDTATPATLLALPQGDGDRRARGRGRKVGAGEHGTTPTALAATGDEDETAMNPLPGAVGGRDNLAMVEGPDASALDVLLIGDI
jgi:hypothetical protein